MAYQPYIKKSDTEIVELPLNASLLDGKGPSYYLDYNNFKNTPTIPTKTSQLTNDSDYTTKKYVDSLSFGDLALPNYIENCDTTLKPGMYPINGDIADSKAPTNNFWGTLIVFKDRISGVTQLAINWHSKLIYYRSAYNGTFSSWSKLIRASDFEGGNSISLSGSTPSGTNTQGYYLPNTGQIGINPNAGYSFRFWQYIKNPNDGMYYTDFFPTKTDVQSLGNSSFRYLNTYSKNVICDTLKGLSSSSATISSGVGTISLDTNALYMCVLLVGTTYRSAPIYFGSSLSYCRMADYAIGIDNQGNIRVINGDGSATNTSVNGTLTMYKLLQN